MGMRPQIRSDVFENARELYCDGTDGSAVGICTFAFVLVKQVEFLLVKQVNAREFYCDGIGGSVVGPDGRVTGAPVADPEEAEHLCEMCGGAKVLLWTPREVLNFRALLVQKYKY
jgi:hypothetical protein